MSHFHSKNFKGVEYQLGHLDPVFREISVNSDPQIKTDVFVVFGCHCFTEEFISEVHEDQHKYTFQRETRAFDVERYRCSLHLPKVLEKLFSGRIHRADKSYTYVAQIKLGTEVQNQAYSVFFSLDLDKSKSPSALKMFVKSAYLKPLVAGSNAQTWRFISLVGSTLGIFDKQKSPKPKPIKKAPKGLSR